MIRSKRTLGAHFVCALSLCSAVAAASVTLLAGCSAQDNPTASQNEEGTAEVVALALSSADITGTTVTVSGPAGGPLPNPLVFPLQKNGNRWSSLISGIPVGSGYSFTLAAIDASGAVIYKGSASPVTISKSGAVQVVITAQQVNAPAPFKNAAPVIDSVVVSSVTVAPGDTITLTAAAHDPSPTDSISFAWTAGAGSFSAPFVQTTSWVAPSKTGTFPITLTVKDQSGATVTLQVAIVVAAQPGRGAAEVTATLNTWPVVTNLVGTPNYLVKGVPTPLTAQANDADSDPLTYGWTSTCPGTFSSPESPTPSFTLSATAQAKDCTLTVAVRDGHGGSTTGSLQLPVGQPSVGVAPQITQTSQSTRTVGSSDQVVLSVQATDPQGLPLSFTWAATGGTFSDQKDAAGQSQVVWSPPETAAASWVLTATVTDTAGLATPYTFTVRPGSCFGPQPQAAQPWRFAVMADTQWTVADDGKNPNSVAVEVIQQLNAQFIAQGVKLVVAVGDVTDNGSTAALDTRATFTQSLYNAGIGFFPLRGNHESSKTAAAEFTRVFPQTRTGLQNATPGDAFLAHPDDINTHPASPLGSTFSVGSSFSSPSTALAGLSYAFDYANVRFLLLDQFTPPDGSSNSIKAQQSWITATLAGRPTGTHAFVFGHKGLITEDHEDTLFGSNPSQDPAGQDAFITSLAQNGVRYLVGGHDHMHNRALVTTTDGVTASVQDITTASDSSKFYSPAVPSNDDKYDVPAFGHKRETPIAQELGTLGYYLVTVVEGRVTVDFYSAAAESGSGNITTVPPLNFTKRESFGYGLNGKEFIIPSGGSYAGLQDSYAGTTAKILGGTNASTLTDGSGRLLSRTVDTAWSNATCETSSALLSLWITGAMGTGKTDTYALSLTYDPTTIGADQLAGGGFGVGEKKSDGSWVNAIDRNFGGTKTFVSGPWRPEYGLGTYGIDTATHTAWAVLNHSGEYALTRLGPVAPVPVQILAINDFHGQISAGKVVSGRPVGSAAVMSAYLKTAMAGQEDRTLIAEVGDLVGASPASSALLQDEPTIDFFNSFANSKCAVLPPVTQQSTGLSRFDALFDPECNLVGIPGNHEFDEGESELMRLIGGGNHAKGPFLDNPWAGARFPLVASNVTDSNGNFLFRPYVIKSVGGQRIAFVGAVLKDTPSIVVPAGVAGLKFSDEAEAINTQVKVLQGLGIHAIVAVIHAGGTQKSYSGATNPTAEAPSTELTGLIGRLDADVDVALTAHSHAFTNALVKNAGNREVLVTQAYSAGTAYADLDLVIDPTTQDIVQKSASIVTTYADLSGLVPDTALQQLTSAAETLVGPIANTVVTTVTGTLSRNQTSAGESPLGDLIAEVHRTAMAADFGITNPGGLRADLPITCTTSPCNVTWNDCFTAQPFGNQVMAIQLTGQQLVAALEQQWAGQTSPKMLQIAGFTFQWSASAPVGARVVPGSLQKADGTPIDLAASYTVALNNFLQGGGDGFTVFKTGTQVVPGPVDVDALLAYFKAAPQPVTLKTDGRIAVRP